MVNCGMLVMFRVLYMHCLPSGMILEVNGVDLVVLDLSLVRDDQV